MTHLHPVTRSSALSAALVACALSLAGAARAVPTTMTYAGVLTDDGVRVEGPVDVTFRLFDDETAGTEQYSEVQQGVLVLDGELVTELGANALDDATLELPELWLEVTVDATPLTPRVRLNSVPYALRAEAASRAEEALTLGGLLATDVVTQSQLAALGLNGGLVAGTGISIASGTVSLATAGVTSVHLAPSAVTNAAIADGAVTLEKLANNSVDAARIIDGAITLAKVASNSVNGSAIVDGTVGTADLANSAVDSAKIADGTVALGDLASSSVDSGKILNGSIQSLDLGLNSVTATAIGVGEVGTSEILDATIVGADIAPATIAGTNVANGAIGTAQIADDAIGLAKLAAPLPIFQIVAIGCALDPGSLTLTATCTAVSAGCPAGQCQNCNTSLCGPCAQPVCPNAFANGFFLGNL